MINMATDICSSECNIIDSDIPKSIELTVDAIRSNLNEVQSFIKNYLDKFSISHDKISKILLSSEEIFINICNYAYSKSIGRMTVSCCLSKNKDIFILRMIDNGKEFNPLEVSAPNNILNTSDENDLKIGGLGIYLMKKSMDDFQYCYRNGSNILTMEKRII